MIGHIATTFGLAGRDFIRKGMTADLVILDADTIIDRASFENPVQLASGIREIYVNGVNTYCNGIWTGKLPGQLLQSTH